MPNGLSENRQQMIIQYLIYPEKVLRYMPDGQVKTYKGKKWEYAARDSLGGVRRPWSGGWKQAREQKMWVGWREKMCGKIQALQWVVLNQTVMTSMIWQEMLLSSVVTGMIKTHR